MVKQNEQLEFFAEPAGDDQSVVHEPDYEAIAAAGDRRNQDYDPNARSAENRRGSGGGFAAALAGEIEVEASTTESSENQVSAPRGKTDRRRLSSRGQLMADREPDTKHDPTYQPPRELDERTQEVGRMGVALAQEIIKARKKDQ